MKPLAEYVPEFFFWGKRKYVHGSHMLLALFEAFEKWGFAPVDRVTAAFRENSTCAGVFKLYDSADEAADESGTFHATFKVQGGGRGYFVGLAPTDKAVTRHQPDDEGVLVAHAEVDGDIASVSNYPESRWLNTVIALTKVHNNETILSEGFEPWFMAQIDLHVSKIDRENPGAVVIRRTSVLGRKMTRSDIIVSGKKCGTIFFNRKAIF